MWGLWLDVVGLVLLTHGGPFEAPVLFQPLASPLSSDLGWVGLRTRHEAPCLAATW